MIPIRKYEDDPSSPSHWTSCRCRLSSWTKPSAHWTASHCCSHTNCCVSSEVFLKTLGARRGPRAEKRKKGGDPWRRRRRRRTRRRRRNGSQPKTREFNGVNGGEGRKTALNQQWMSLNEETTFHVRFHWLWPFDFHRFLLLLFLLRLSVEYPQGWAPHLTICVGSAFLWVSFLE